jgi:hypothetical protein
MHSDCAQGFISAEAWFYQCEGLCALTKDGVEGRF